MRVAVPVGEAVVLAVVRDPLDDRSLDGHAARTASVTRSHRGPGSPVGEIAVEADRDAVTGHDVHEDGDDGIPPRQEPHCPQIGTAASSARKGTTRNRARVNCSVRVLYSVVSGPPGQPVGLRARERGVPR